jgi:hypothetical protein
VGPTCQTTHVASGTRGSASLPRGCHSARRSLACAAAASPLTPLSRLPRAARRSPHRPRRRPDCSCPKPPTSPAVPAPVSRPFLGHLPCGGAVSPLARRAAPPPRALTLCATCCAGRPSWAAHAGCASATSTGRAPRGRGPCAHTVRVGRARFRPSGTQFKFYIF